jgi:hypothetical protein
VRSQSVDAFTVIADLRAPQIFDLLSVLGRVQHAPAINAQLAVCKLRWPRSFEQNFRVTKWIVGRG